MNNAIQIAGLRHAYAGQGVLDLPELTIAQGARHLVVGPSGSGKTTLLHVIAGLLRPTAGSVQVAGCDVTALRPAQLDRLRGRELGIVFQQLHLMASLTALENLLLARYLAGLPQVVEHCLQVLDELGVARRADARPAALSRGEAQRVALARALVNEPRILLADEPTASLDDAACESVAGLLDEQASARNITLLVATHDGRLRDRFGDFTELRSCA